MQVPVSDEVPLSSILCSIITFLSWRFQGVSLCCFLRSKKPRMGHKFLEDDSVDVVGGVTVDLQRFIAWLLQCYLSILEPVRFKNALIPERYPDALLAELELCVLAMLIRAAASISMFS
jgi:hypothetical protein